jgi:hypothetical protein
MSNDVGIDSYVQKVTGRNLAIPRPSPVGRELSLKLFSYFAFGQVIMIHRCFCFSNDEQALTSHNLSNCILRSKVDLNALVL